MKFILYIATSVDGYIARLNGSIDWLPTPEAYEDNSYNQFYHSIDALVMGSTTYKQVLEFGDWAYSGKLAYVLTRQNLSTARPDVVFVKGVEEVVEDAQKRGYQRVWLMGGGKVASSFMKKGLVDEYIITIIPVILGAGISLYQSVPELNLNLISEKYYAFGAVELHYTKK